MSISNDYHRLADQHRPQTEAGIRAAVLELARGGLSDYDVAHVMRLDVNQVRRMIAAPPEEAAWLHAEGWK